MPKRGPLESPTTLAAEALSLTAGAALVLDANLAIVLATPAAETLLGASVPLGIAAPKLLCGNSPKKPVAQALVEGRSIEAIIPKPGPNAEQRMLKVRSVPLAEHGKPRGWLLLLDDAAALSEKPVLFQGMWSRSPEMKEVFRIIERVAPENVTVLVRGETGSGKELVAHALHTLSPRSRQPFRALNCAAVPQSLLESELFGHVRGAFTGAVRDAPGHFQLANRGTLFLDEVGELPLEVQSKLLRVLETGSVLPVGARQPVEVDVRIVSATHRALRQEVDAGRFRADLMYRLRVIPIFVPPLRERREDVSLLAEKLIESMNVDARRRIERISPAALTALERHDWPGNVRELKNVLAYAYAIGDGPILQPSDLPAELRQLSANPAATPRPVTDDPELRHILEVLERTGGNKSQAAQILGISRVTLWRRLQELKLA